MKHWKIVIGLIFTIAIMISCNSNSQTNIESQNYTQEQIDSLKRIECDTLLSEMRKIKADTFIKISTLPKNFEESLVILDSMMNPKMKEWIKCLPNGEFGGYVHHGFGTFLRNSWGLWGNSELAVKLYEKGILHPDDMSGIILDSYQRKIKGEKIQLDKQIKYYQDYWRETDMPVDSILNQIEEQKKNKQNGG